MFGQIAAQLLSPLNRTRAAAERDAIREERMHLSRQLRDLETDILTREQAGWRVTGLALGLDVRRIRKPDETLKKSDGSHFDTTEAWSIFTFESPEVVECIQHYPKLEWYLRQDLVHVMKVYWIREIGLGVEIPTIATRHFPITFMPGTRPPVLERGDDVQTTQEYRTQVRVETHVSIEQIPDVTFQDRNLPGPLLEKLVARLLLVKDHMREPYSFDSK